MNWFAADTNSDSVADIFGASYLGNYDEDIQAFVDANAERLEGTGKFQDLPNRLKGDFNMADVPLLAR